MLELPESLCEDVEESDAGSEVLRAGSGEDATRVGGLELWEEVSWTAGVGVARVGFL